MTEDTNELLPTAEYAGPVLKRFEVDPSKPHSTSGRTNGPSDYVLAAGAVDRDAPTEATDTRIGRLRAYLTTLQDEVNEFLTERMKTKGEEEGQDLVNFEEEEDEDQTGV
ncbi:hypothetical protein KL905_001486 [Ogataea polymorpha]|uniref:EKC/KEOPS complex subunit GON7 n=1 Tax=Ogataea polymorpha TaxID=460523 RepID=A0A1B7SM15_9ASCO|nr:uncharacterized protein OGAPODRAFT_6992 [Ogataea polymorpha]KAG7879993.1 hypothetical protein KL937_002877 [Ogataea polymorpha]KAG7897079.1 hypothetical protein KL908_000481 [Ogataea polymorpha]KAG7903115.1 hypothetical protein KL935_000647 [Ogataea polymorpha]KAG7912279.1 hypothetical protein KL906_000483 [Ogataea polymorpha]KAG7919958.1 hypothetical protein KL927_000638 [Ogataea polymorpha]